MQDNIILQIQALKLRDFWIKGIATYTGLTNTIYRITKYGMITIKHYNHFLKNWSRVDRKSFLSVTRN